MRRLSIPVAALLLALAAAVPASAGSAGSTSVVVPAAMKVAAGSAGGSLHAVAVRDQFGTDDDPGAYLQASPGAAKFNVRFLLPLEQPPLIGSLDLVTSIRTEAGGWWRLQVRDHRTGRWVTVRRSHASQEVRWVVRVRRLDPAAVAGPGGLLKVRVVGGGAPVSIDYLAARRSVWQPSPGTTWQIQLTGDIDTGLDVEMYDIDLFDVPQAVIDELHADGRVVVCYFSAGAWEDWRPDAGAYPDEVLGADNGWPGERWLDIRQLAVLRPILEERLDLAVAKGCDGVDPDNVDGYANETGFPLTAADQERFNRWLASAAHRSGLSVGLKNDLGQIPELVGVFDWALNEQCRQYGECGLLAPFVDAGKAVFAIEYRGSVNDICPAAQTLGHSTLKKRLVLGAWVRAC